MVGLREKREGKNNPKSERPTELTAYMHRSTVIVKPFLQGITWESLRDSSSLVEI